MGERHWPIAILAFAVFGLLSVLFLKVNPSPFELAQESFVNFCELIIFLACIFGAFGIGVKKVIEEIMS